MSPGFPRRLGSRFAADSADPAGPAASGNSIDAINRGAGDEGEDNRPLPRAGTAAETQRRESEARARRKAGESEAQERSER